MSPNTYLIEADSLGQCWPRVSRLIMEQGQPSRYDGAITTFMPLTDTIYIPCVSWLDFWMPDRALELVVYAHSLDFGKKAYGNVIELAALQSPVAGQLERPAGKLVIHAKSAHLYEPEWDSMQRLCDRVGV